MIEKTEPEYDVFVSYEDKTGLDFAVHLKKTLEKKEIGMRTFVAKKDARRNSRESIDRAIESCRYFVVIITELACSSTDVKREVELALSLGKDIIPCKYEDTPRSLTLKLSLDKIQQLDFDTREALARKVLTKLLEPRIKEEVTKLVPEIFSGDTYGGLRARKLHEIVESVYPPFCPAGEEMCKLMIGADGDELSALRLKFLRENKKDYVKILDASVAIGSSFGLVRDVYDHIEVSIQECKGFTGEEIGDQAMLKITMMEYEIFHAMTNKSTLREFVKRMGRHDILSDLDKITDIYSQIMSIKNALKHGKDLSVSLPKLKKIEKQLTHIKDVMREDLDAERKNVYMISPVVRNLYEIYGIEEQDLINAKMSRIRW